MNLFGKKKGTIEAYRRVFIHNPEGIAVLTDILNDLHFFDQRLDSDEKMIKHNIATDLMAKCGIWRPHNLFGIVDDLAKLNPYDGSEDY